MATIYEFIVKQQTSGNGGGRKSTSSKPSKKTVAKKGKWVSVFGVGEKGGVEHNRKLRAINPLLNRMTGGWAEKSLRLGRAGMGLVKRNTETGKLGLSGPAIAIIIAFIIQTYMSIQNKWVAKREKENTQNYKKMETGMSIIRGEYEINRNLWDGKITYNQNK